MLSRRQQRIDLGLASPHDAVSAGRPSSPQPPPGRKHARDLRWCPFAEGDPKLNYLRTTQDDYTLEDSFHAICHDPLGLGIVERVAYDDAQRRKAAGLPSLRDELGAWLQAGCPIEMEDGSISRSGGGDTILTTPAGGGAAEEEEPPVEPPQEVSPLMEALYAVGYRPAFQEPIRHGPMPLKLIMEQEQQKAAVAKPQAPAPLAAKPVAAVPAAAAKPRIQTWSLSANQRARAERYREKVQREYAEREAREPVCYNCHDLGHIARRCPLPYIPRERPAQPQRPSRQAPTLSLGDFL
jgi:hypothetical protein